MNSINAYFTFFRAINSIIKPFYICLITLWSILITPLPAQVIFNEFMIDPANDNTGEFIEIYNLSDSVIDISHYYICDEQDTDAVIFYSDSLLFPNCYGLIIDPDYSGEYDDHIPDSIPLFTLEDSRFGKYGISNSTSKLFSVLDNDFDICDSYKTGSPDWPDPEHSIERKSFPDTVWCESLNIGGTPGTRNSTAVKDHDMSLFDLTCQINNEALFISFTFKNIGSKPIIRFNYGYIVDMPNQNLYSGDTLLFTFDSLFAPGDSLHVSNASSSFSKGHIKISAFFQLNDLLDTVQNAFFIPLDPDELLVTEFVCKTGEDFSSEYIEIVSKCDVPIQLFGMEIHDLTGFTCIDSNYALMPDSIIVLAQSASFYDDFPFVENYIIPPAWRSLNNSEDIIRLQNPSGSMIFNLHYDAVWNIASDCAMQLVDTALNYDDPANWEISYLGSPGKFNITEKQLRHLSIIDKVDFFTPLDTLKLNIVNDGYFPIDEISCTCQTQLSEQIIYLPATTPGDTLTIEIDTSQIFVAGTNLCTLQYGYAGGGSHELKPTIHYFKYYYPYSDTPVFFNEIMFDPIDTYGQVEFIELTCSQPPLDLEHWKIKVNNYMFHLADSLSNFFTALCDADDPLQGISTSARRTYSRFASLPNAGAEIWLFDPMDRVMDHVDLRDHDEISSGKSLEKQFLSCPSDEASIWLSSVCEFGMTPGKHNSISALPSSRYAFDIYPQIFNPAQDDLLQFSIDAEGPILFCELYCFNPAGQCVYQHMQNTFNSTSFLHFWNAKSGSGNFLPRGLYLALVLLHDQQGRVLRLRETFVIS